MRLKRSRKFVIALFLRTRQGSLLIECIFAIWVLTLSFFLLHTFWIGINKQTDLLHMSENQMQWTVFLEKLQTELYRSDFSQIQVYRRQIYFLNSQNEKISYEVNKGKLRRQVFHAGNDIVLLGVKDAVFTLAPDGRSIMIQVEFLNGEKKKEWIFYHKV